MEADKVLHKEKSLVPKLRFNKFVDDWRKKRLGEIASITTGNTPSTTVAEYYNGSKLFVSPADLSEGRYVYKTKTTLTELGFNEGRKISKGSVLFVCIGSTIGKVGQAAEECLTNQQINSLEGFKEFDNDFIYGLLEKNGKKIKLLAGVQAVPQINKTDFSNFKYYIPAFPEQQKIASFLSAIDEKIQQLTRKKELLELYKKGVIQQLFSGKLRFKDENGKAFPKWEEKKIKDFVLDKKGAMKIGPFGSQLKKTTFVSDGFKVYGQENIFIADFDFGDRYITEAHFNTLKANELHAGDFVISTMGTIGKCCLVPPSIKKPTGLSVSPQLA